MFSLRTRGAQILARNKRPLENVRKERSKILRTAEKLAVCAHESVRQVKQTQTWIHFPARKGGQGGVQQKCNILVVFPDSRSIW